MDPGPQFQPTKHSPGDSDPYTRGGKHWEPSPGKEFGTPIDVSGLHFKLSSVERARGYAKDGSLRKTQPAPVHWLTAHNHKGQELGQLIWASDTGRISHTHVGEQYRGLGVATSLHEHARNLADLGALKAPRHSNNRTKSGDALARNLSQQFGTKVPRNLDLPDSRRRMQ